MKKLFSLITIAIIACSALNAQDGKVGINTTTPQAMLHVKDSSVLFSGGNDIPATPGNPPLSGAGIRMMWYPDKASFRAGRVVAGSWDKDSVGPYSFASGFNTKAINYSSTAMGYNTTASGAQSTALGVNNVASGGASTALGANSFASGIGSTTIGYGTIASGNYSTAMGYGSYASALNSIAMGYYTSASEEASTAMGYYTIASGLYSTSMGTYTTASGYASIAMGEATTASGGAATAMGGGVNATGDHSTGMGLGTNSRPFTSLVIGRYNDPVSTSSMTSWVSTDPVFIIGNGNSNSTRSNAFVIYKNGNTTLTGKLNKPSAGNADLVPVCYGSVSSAAGINSGTSNFIVASSATGEYNITITNETYSNTGYITNVTPAGETSFRAATTDTSGGNLKVRVFDNSGNLVNTAFHFIVYKQ